MQCENGYTKPGVKGILCRKCEEPKTGDLRSVAHAMCGHQRFCPNARCYTMLPGWEKCTKRETPQSAPLAALTAPLAGEHSEGREEAAEEEMTVKKGKRTAKKKNAEKAADGE